MGKNLYFVCPTDHMEAIIDGASSERNYYCSSLGNSVDFDDETMLELGRMLESRGIRKIAFVLSDDNRFVVNAMRGREASLVSGLCDVYKEIISEKDTSELLWRKCDLQAVVIARLLRRKMGELQAKLAKGAFGEVELQGKIYFRQQQVFHSVDSKISDRELFNLN